MDNIKKITILKMIATDIENDMTEMEGQEFNGKNVATQFGNQAAAIASLAKIIQTLLE